MILDYQETRSVVFDRPAGDGGWGNGSSPYPNTCEYCATPLNEILDTRRWGNIPWRGGEDRNYRLLAVCETCGWWVLKEQDNIETATIAYTEVTQLATLRRFDVASNDVPINSLRDYLRRHEAQFYNVNPTKFERLVADVFKDFHHCEVTHVGRTGDGGIDLLVVDSDRPLPIQVKRRSNVARWEPVSTVRDFLGAILLKGLARGAIVTTAGHFSAAAIGAAEVAEERKLVERLARSGENLRH